MTESMFIHMDAMNNKRIDLGAFQRAFREKYRDLEIRPVSDEQQYCLSWQMRNEDCEFAGMLDRRRVTFVIDYFRAGGDREKKLAELILWLRSWFPENAGVIFCDDTYETVYRFRPETDAAELMTLLA